IKLKQIHNTNPPTPTNVYLCVGTPTQTATQNTTRHLTFCEQRMPEMLSLLQRMVEIESPSDNKATVDKMGEFLAQEFQNRGGRINIHNVTEYGNHLQIEFAGTK